MGWFQGRRERGGVRAGGEKGLVARGLARRDGDAGDAAESEVVGIGDGVAGELVSTDRRYRDVIDNLLGRTVVAETLADAVQMSGKHQNALRIVTLDGQMINAGGSMTGGSAARNVGILSRVNERKKLQARLPSLEKDLNDCTAQLAEAERVLTGAKYETETAAAEREQTVSQVSAVSSTLLLRKTASRKCSQRPSILLQSSLFLTAKKWRITSSLP